MEEALNDVQKLLGQLEDKGWTISAVADALQVGKNTVFRWRAGSRYPDNSTAVKHELERLLARKRVPKKRRKRKGDVSQVESGADTAPAGEAPSPTEAPPSAWTGTRLPSSSS